MTDRDVVTVERVVHAPAAEIFALLADPTRHHEFDGSGTVRGAKGSAGPVGLGDRFGMSMKMGLPYSMENTIIEFERDRRMGGRVWRYELEPTDDGTLVRESWDITGESVFTKPAVRRAAGVTEKNMASTLDRIEELLASP